MGVAATRASNTLRCTSGTVEQAVVASQLKKLKFEAGLDIPSMHFGGFCLIRVEVPIWGGDCAVYVPSFPLFTAAPDIAIPLYLSPILGSS